MVFGSRTLLDRFFGFCLDPHGFEAKTHVAQVSANWAQIPTNNRKRAQIKKVYRELLRITLDSALSGVY